MTDTSFPRQQARTARFSLGVPRGVVIAPGGDRIVFLRTRTGSDRQTCLWSQQIGSGEARLLVDPATALAGDDAGKELPPEEKARRERSREASMGVVRFSADDALEVVAFDLSGRLFVADVATGQVRQLPATGPVVDPRIDPTGSLVAYVSTGALRVVPTGKGSGTAPGGHDAAPAEGAAPGGSGLPRARALPGDDTVLAAPDGPAVTYGLAEFVAAEEMDRQEGYWWSPDGSRLLVARVDNSGVAVRYIADPAHPESPPAELFYPAAGTANAEVRLFLVDLAGALVEVEWDRLGYEYVVAVNWDAHELLVVVESRDQRRMQVLAVDTATGATEVVRAFSDDVWLDVVPGVPCHLADGSLVWTADANGTRSLLVGGDLVTPPGLQVRSVLGTDADTVFFQASADPTEIEVFAWAAAGTVTRIGPAGGVATAVTRAGTIVLNRGSLEQPGRKMTVLRGREEVDTVESVAETPILTTSPLLRSYTKHELRTAVIFPTGHVPGSGKLPVLMSPYGGPHAQMVLAFSNLYLEEQWFADQGFAVVVPDGHGTPGRGREWDRSIRGDFASLVLQDQVDALEAAAAEWSDLDTSRVGIRGWSFGGYLAALAVLRRPDVFHAAVSGAPVTEWHLYDTFYTERYLGHPDTEPENYERSSLLGDAAGLAGKLLFIHGMADDNVTVAHTLQLSSALLAAGRPHSILPLSGVTHMTPQEVVAANRLLFELEFLRSALDAG